MWIPEDRMQLAVARTVPLPLTLVVATAADATPPDVLAVEGRFVRDGTGYCGRDDLAAARARAVVRSGRTRFAAEVELAPWSEATTEVVVRPTARAPHRWSARRRRRWYVGAHAAADALRAALLRSAPDATRHRLAAGRPGHAPGRSDAAPGRAVSGSARRRA